VADDRRPPDDRRVELGGAPPGDGRAELGDAPPFLTWRAIYAVVIAALAAAIALCGALTALYR
jgi:hypothetical protein